MSTFRLPITTPFKIQVVQTLRGACLNVLVGMEFKLTIQLCEARWSTSSQSKNLKDVSLDVGA